MKRLYLYGPPASGKTTRALALARRFKVKAVDLDEAIVAKIGMPIARYFAEKGEAAFRHLEAETLREVDADIVALGGGTLLKDENRAYAEEHGFVAVLDADEQTLAARIAAQQGLRPLGDMFAKRRAHYASFPHHVTDETQIVLPSSLAGSVAVPVSKSHLHRLLIADFLATGAREVLPALPGDCADIAATRRCLAALAAREEVLDCGESGSTLRFLAPVAAALGVKARFIRHGRLAERPMLDFSHLAAGRHVLRGDISSQFVSGLLFALPLLDKPSRIVFSTPLESRGYVAMTCDVLRRYGIKIVPEPDGFTVPAPQTYQRAEGVALMPEGDWSGAAFWFAANALGADVTPTNLCATSLQPDRVVCELVPRVKQGGAEIDISPCPDLFPALAVTAAATPAGTRFVNAARLRLKESDRIVAMQRVLDALGVANEATADTVTVHGTAGAFAACEIDAQNDHRIAMAAAVAALRAEGPVLIQSARCVAKSYPDFFDAYFSLIA